MVLTILSTYLLILFNELTLPDVNVEFIDIYSGIY